MDLGDTKYTSSLQGVLYIDQIKWENSYPSYFGPLDNIFKPAQGSHKKITIECVIMIIPDKVGGGDDSPLGFFYNAPNLAVWLQEALKQTLYSLQTPYFIQTSTYLCLYIRPLTSNLLKRVMSAIRVVLLKSYQKIYKICFRMYLTTQMIRKLRKKKIILLCDIFLVLVLL